MKNVQAVLITLFSIFLFSSPNTLSAANIDDLKIKLLDQEKAFSLSFEAKGQGAVSISLFNEEQHFIFSKEVIGGVSFKQAFNLKHLKLGQYTLLIEDDSSITRQPLKVLATEIYLNSADKETDYKPHFNFDQQTKQLSINWLNLKAKAGKISIEDEHLNLFFKNHLAAEMRINKRYDISNFPAGKYFVTLKSGDAIYQQTIQIEY